MFFISISLGKGFGYHAVVVRCLIGSFFVLNQLVMLKEISCFSYVK
jgi:hypothetical protein